MPVTRRAVDDLQQELASTVFAYTSSRKKAAGRALGTIVEIISFYMLKSWGLETQCLIESRLPEFGQHDIRHNVEFSLHPSEHICQQKHSFNYLPITAKKLANRMSEMDIDFSGKIKSGALLTRDFLLKNAFIMATNDMYVYVACYSWNESNYAGFNISRLKHHPYALVECKRVGIEEGVKKGPQTIEKAKQGSYVAKSVSSLQKIKTEYGDVRGVLFINDRPVIKPYVDFLEEIVSSDDASLLGNFTLSVGIASNHGNWFTSDNPNKELKILANAYDWLLFLTDDGIAEFMEDVLLSPSGENQYIRDVFRASYTGESGKNRFTKTKIDLRAHELLSDYFFRNIEKVETWFNPIAPAGKGVAELKEELILLASKDWRAILG